MANINSYNALLQKLKQYVPSNDNEDNITYLGRTKKVLKEQCSDIHNKLALFQLEKDERIRLITEQNPPSFFDKLIDGNSANGRIKLQQLEIEELKLCQDGRHYMKLHEIAESLIKQTD